MADEDGQEKEEYCEFAFKVPNAPPGATMKVTAPDGLVLKIPLPKNIEAGMKLVMHKNEETGGAWRIKCAEAGDEEPPARQQAPQQQQTSETPTPSPAPEAKKEPVPRTVAKASQGGRPRIRTKAELDADLSGRSVITVKLDTTKGPIIMKIVPQWAPLGAERFLQLVNDGYYSEIAIYRAVPKFLVQFGIVKDKARIGKYKKIQDDPLCGVPIQDGTVIFAAAGANTRKSTVCLFLGDYPQLGASPWETPIGKVVPESMSTLHSIYTGYGDIPQCNGKGPDPHKLEELGNSYIAEQFPKCDYVTGASLM
jgi:cyclophilin family peptidyl-prolyl cis-trans isomerase|mmetsp:Transcript_78651/g.122749  ORF Transcript_78651/g.122749 Transcript_78651/m.122749 type:complete len:310 (-) Transcript_78651:42-971(-)|eukprot:CAMPEP_0169119068 /NCGR_PEP_ID=MMETSP1015-20121227/31346_1 /TAXON_ID=342587 /ORGANISM="Karlodinium micrum, Strain CCMP2283" /LENGTH=309 /DNA_ID=CAMNT_0009181897 /DNA_START=62 /DNA_END=991 /DNA_ORIENTATION=+